MPWKAENCLVSESELAYHFDKKVVVYVNKHSDMMFWHIGRYINEDLDYKQYSYYDCKILATLSQTLVWSQFPELQTKRGMEKRVMK